MTWSRALGQEVKEQGVEVYTVLPGFVVRRLHPYRDA